MTDAATAVIARKLVWPGSLVLAMVAVLIGLGVWQLQRKAWKEALIATLDQRLAAAPVALPPRATWDGLDPAVDEFLRVTLRAELRPDTEARVYSNGTALRDDITGPGYFALAPARMPDGSRVVINRGYVADPRPGPSLRPIAVPPGPVEITGLLRWPEPAGLFVTDYNAADDLWFTRDPRAMAQRYGWGEVAPFYIEQEAPTPAGGAPAPGKLRLTLRNEHLQYAITWFGLAAVLVVIFGIWLFSGASPLATSQRAG